MHFVNSIENDRSTSGPTFWRAHSGCALRSASLDFNTCLASQQPDNSHFKETFRLAAVSVQFLCDTATGAIP